MLYFRKRAFGWFIGILISSGCTLSDIQEHGEECLNIQYVLSGNQYDPEESWKTCKSDNCNDYVDFVSLNVCPPTSPYCVMDTTKGNYCTFACVRNTHQVISDEELAKLHDNPKDLPEHLCEIDDQFHCGDDDCTAIIPGWEDGICEDKTCIPTKCKNSYRLDDYPDDVRCVRYDQCCGVYCSVCTNNKNLDKKDPNYKHIICNSNQTETEVECVSKCSEGFQACNGVCLPTKVTCQK